MEVADDLCVARRRRCPYIAFSSLLDLISQAPSANVIVFMERDTKPTGLLPQGLLETMSLKKFLNLLMGRFRNEPLL